MSSLEADRNDNENATSFPTRFRFYEPKPEEPSPQSKSPPINHNRFPFYEPGTAETAAPIDATDNILRSLQETEVQRRNILNPESLNINHTKKDVKESNTPSGDNSDQNPYEDAIKEALDLLRKHRVDENPGPSVDVSRDDVDDLIAKTRTTPRAQLADTYEEQRIKAQQRQERMAQYASRLQKFKSSLPTPQHGSSEDLQPATSADISEITSQTHAEEVQRGVEKVLLAILERASNNSRERGERADDDNSAMSDILALALGDLNIQSKETADTDGTSKPSSVVDELLAEDDGYLQEEKKLPDNSSRAKDKTDANPWPRFEKKHTAVRVLGPLSHEDGSSGVVLDVDESDHAEEDGECEAKSVASTSIVDKYATVPDDDQVTENDQVYVEVDSEEGGDHSLDNEARDLMLTLCAHFLPFGVNSQSKAAIPEWDESDPNEAGYRIIRLTRSQLQRVELAFENMILGLKEKSQEGLGGEETSDAKFARELLEAEKLLDEAEAKKSTHLSNDDTKQETGKAVDVKNSKQDISFTEDGECHPSFPGVKATGKGEMGDLEYFHLPIIFKSHVTGFEPTKDIVLEPGNVVAGQYLVESELGSAAFSTAYRCIDLSTESADVSVYR